MPNPDSNIPTAPPRAIEADAKPIAPEPRKAKPPVRSISLLGWAVALFLLVINRKLGLVAIVLLLVFRQYPWLSISSIASTSGKWWGKGKKALRDRDDS